MNILKRFLLYLCLSALETSSQCIASADLELNMQTRLAWTQRPPPSASRATEIMCSLPLWGKTGSCIYRDKSLIQNEMYNEFEMFLEAHIHVAWLHCSFGSEHKSCLPCTVHVTPLCNAVSAAWGLSSDSRLLYVMNCGGFYYTCFLFLQKQVLLWKTKSFSIFLSSLLDTWVSN